MTHIRSDNIDSALVLRISEAGEGDLEDMSIVMSDAFEPDLQNRLRYGPRRTEAVKKERELMVTNLRAQLLHPPSRFHIIKAVATAGPLSGRMVGWSLFRWSHGDKPNRPPTMPPDSEKGETDFTMYLWRECNEKYVQLMGDRKHVGRPIPLLLSYFYTAKVNISTSVLSSMYVLPEAQRSGVGSKLLQWAFQQYDLAKEEIFVQSVHASEGFYQKFGWVTKSSTEIDLSDWAGKNQGWGLYRSPQLIRTPQTLGRLDG
ncbi:MAG: hypothetical protein GOMPHAMPRED_004257 [Gomphillus americanus]|uniref:N-acetyltransferase domain-containing protein n=1 Tax=Gomphillus americanus TaxID=1940652 RepID=A0A8H3FLT1_9LECA|nr:MAG: hypothetical protein GOMPHAMPRED_004257 [Gomphillus americanus]